MSEEPTYTFVKGQGWVVYGYQVHVFEKDGLKVFMSEKPPVMGERYYLISKHEPRVEGALNHLFHMARQDRAHNCGFAGDYTRLATVGEDGSTLEEYLEAYDIYTVWYE